MCVCIYIYVYLVICCICMYTYVVYCLVKGLWICVLICSCRIVTYQKTSQDLDLMIKALMNERKKESMNE